MDKATAAYTEHVLSLFTEVLHENMTDKPLRDLNAGITPSLAQALQFVYQHDVCSVRDVAAGLSMTLPAASQLVDRLVRKEWVSKCDNTHDRRLSEIRLTDSGRTLAERIRVEKTERMAGILNRMPPESRTCLVRSLETFIAAGMNSPLDALSQCIHCGVDHKPECVVNEVYQTATGAQIDKF